MLLFNAIDGEEMGKKRPNKQKSKYCNIFYTTPPNK